MSSDWKKNVGVPGPPGPSGGPRGMGTVNLQTALKKKCGELRGADMTQGVFRLLMRPVYCMEPGYHGCSLTET